MAIRLRMTEAGLVALCAARSVEKPGDRYLDDEEHYALAEKFWRDYADTPLLPPCRKAVAEAVEREESNNPNREEWDRTFGDCESCN